MVRLVRLLVTRHSDLYGSVQIAHFECSFFRVTTQYWHLLCATVQIRLSIQRKVKPMAQYAWE